MRAGTSFDVQGVFIRLPRLVRQCLVLGQSARNRATRYGSEYKRLRAILETSQYWELEKMVAFQGEQLSRLLIEAKHSTRYYREAFKGFTEEELREIGKRLDVARLPLLEKATLKARTSEFFNTSRSKFIKSSTSGSTGSPLVVEYDRVSVQQRFAHIHRLRSWGGVSAFDRHVRMSGRLLAGARTEREPWLLNPFESMLLVSTYHLLEPHLNRIVERIVQFRPALIDGYPTAIEQLARHVCSMGLRIPSLRMVITTAETLSPASRCNIQDGLGVPVFDYYAASEGVSLICQCESGSYHVCVDSGIFEFLREDGRVASPGEIGEIVVTSFCQWRTPLIRYRTGDVVMLPPDPDRVCSCGRSFPMVAGIVGRVEDLVLTRDGRSIGMFPYRTLKYVPGLREAQILQKGHETFIVRVVADGSRARDELQRDLTRVFSDVVGYPVSVGVEIVGAIDRGANGKFRALVRAFDVS